MQRQPRGHRVPHQSVVLTAHWTGTHQSTVNELDCACACVCTCVCCRLLESQVECLRQELAGCRKEVGQSRTASALLEQQLKGGSLAGGLAGIVVDKMHVPGDT